VAHRPTGMLWTIIGVGLLTAALLWVYDRMLPVPQDGPDRP